MGMDCIVSKLARRGKIWDFDNGMSFDTGKGGRNCKKREALWMSHKPSLLEQPVPGSDWMILGGVTRVAFYLRESAVTPP